MRGAIVLAVLLMMIPVSVQATEGAIISPELERTLVREYSVSAEVVDQVVDTGIGYDDAIVSLHFAQRAEMSPVRVATLRSQGGTWREIAQVRGVTPRDFYIMVSGAIPSPRYAAIMDKFGFSVPPSNDWNRVPLTDADIVDLVHAKFIASGYDYNIFETMALRDEGMGFAEIRTEISDRKQTLMNRQRMERRSTVDFYHRGYLRIFDPFNIPGHIA